MKLLAPLALCLGLLAFSQPQPSTELVWSDFTRWLAAQPPNSKPGDLIHSYRESLDRQGIPNDEAAHRMSVISDAIFTRRKGVEQGTALDVGMGQGRNAVYLAAQGWDVTGFDPSGEGVRISRSHAQTAGVKLRALVARDDEFEYGESRWDLIVVTYVRDLRQDDAVRFSKALRPGGILVYENGADTDNAVLRAFLGFQIVRFEDIEMAPEWNPDHQIRVQRLIARKAMK